MAHNQIKPYGDTTGDGAVQLSFTLPLPAGGLAREAARRLCEKMQLAQPQVVHMQDLGGGCTFFVVYARVKEGVDLTGIKVPEAAAPTWTREEIEALAAQRLGRPIIVVGACTGSDAHTVGLDAILNMKGYRGDPGLERYRCFTVHNMGSQVPNEELAARVREVGADAVLVSQVVTQKDVHLRNLTHLVDLLEAEGLRERLILVVGGPRITHELAVELGFDAGFGPGTLPSTVAAFLLQRMLERTEKERPGCA